MFDEESKRILLKTAILIQTKFIGGHYTSDIQRWNPQRRRWPRERRQGHILKSLASKRPILKNCFVLGSRTALFFVPLKSCWKTPKISRKICYELLWFSQLEIA